MPDAAAGSAKKLLPVEDEAVRLAGEAIPLASRIMAVADQYDALRSPRPYKGALSHERTCGTLLEGDGRTMPGHFYPAVLGALAGTLEAFRGIYDSIEQAT
jgi:putative two-component system response regulator